MDNIVTSMLFATIVAGTPLIITALGELVTEKSGVLNLGAEGHHGGRRDRRLRRRARFRQHLRRASLAGLLAGAAMSAHLRGPDADADGEPGRLGARAVDLRRRTVRVHRQAVRIGDAARRARAPASRSSPTSRCSGRALFDQQCARLPVVAAVRRRRRGSSTESRAGLVLRAVGESPVSAHSIGYPVIRIRYLATLFGGAMAGRRRRVPVGVLHAAVGRGDGRGARLDRARAGRVRDLAAGARAASAPTCSAA